MGCTVQHEHEVQKECLSDPCPWCLASTTWPVTPPSSGPTTSPSSSPPGASTTQAESKFIFLISQHLCYPMEDFFFNEGEELVL